VILPDLTHFFDDWITATLLCCGSLVCHGSTLSSSSGVQMTDGLYPSDRITDSYFFRSVAFAMCVRFHVSKKPMPFTVATATWSASS
jgi:hypothetical protein